jgi:hypothetical protein
MITHGIIMAKKRVMFVEICIGLLLIIIGLIVWWWSRQLLWILIYPPPLTKQLIESLPIICWGLGILLVMDGVRRKIPDHPI